METKRDLFPTVVYLAKRLLHSFIVTPQAFGPEDASHRRLMKRRPFRACAAVSPDP